ncbi:uncharacterized protein FPRO_14752 [Fusarium proliferatum ET1]|uniref:Uncharacterized protein n=1 Tax=Fusarium proliferatum (strain ET1) TaxID=1227346 RepID=A0A1L7VX53_FUSPR|nr:uncharacterized protein FPRO_14752 [Fusarium proliferatum ET1]CZR45000.1 uncharacterized protein FPRO_14752 [Fusarium proliferatum ET1]
MSLEAVLLILITSLYYIKINVNLLDNTFIDKEILRL